MSRRMVKSTTVAAFVLLALAVVGCGSSSSSSSTTQAANTSSGSGSGSSTPSGPVPTFKVALPVAQAAIGSQIVLGVEGGFFKKQGVNVVINTGLGSNTGPAVVAGQDDIGQLGMAAPLQYAKAGKSTTVIYGSTGLGLASNLYTAKKITSIAQLKATKPCTIATLTAGSSVYGTSSYFNKTLGLGCKLVVFSGTPEIIGAVSTGRADAATGVNDSMEAAIAAGKANELINSESAADRAKYLTSQLFTDVDYFGMTANLASKKEAVVRFLKGMGQVNQFIQTGDPTAIATLLHKNSDYQTLSVATLAKQIQSDRGYIAPYSGYINQSDWARGLQVLNSYGLMGFTPTDPTYAYNQRVDMSYYTEALGQPPSGS
jgi:ABC-type nitrate/sulfonate/bicarbonate transport system substrate-binding protein